VTTLDRVGFIVLLTSSDKVTGSRKVIMSSSAGNFLLWRSYRKAYLPVGSGAPPAICGVLK
jgi:hypothetical protein